MRIELFLVHNPVHNGSVEQLKAGSWLDIDCFDHYKHRIIDEIFERMSDPFKPCRPDGDL